MSQQVKLQRGVDLMPDEQIPLGFVVVCLAAVVFFGLGVWKACEIAAWVMHGAGG